MVSFFRNLGDDWNVKPGVIDSIEEFTCLMYGQALENSVDTVCCVMPEKMAGDDKHLAIKSKVDFARLPPCLDRLIPHIESVNHRLSNYKCAATPVFWRPKPYDPGQGWQKTADGILEPVGSREPVLPPSLVDLLENTADEAENNEDGNELLEIDYDELFDDDDAFVLITRRRPTSFIASL